MSSRRALVLALTLTATTVLEAQRPASSRPSPPAAGVAATAPAPTLASEWLSGIPARSLGPAVTGGRIVAIAVPESVGGRLGQTMYIAAASGGVWKTTNAGTTWEATFEGQSVASIGDVAVAPSNAQIVWVGTGEANNQRSSSWGDGIYKSENGGKTWTKKGLAASQHIGRIVIHPTKPDIVYVAAAGPLWTSGGERGVYKTTDGGTTWSAVKTVDEHTGAIDLVMDPSDPDTLYAATYQRQRKAYSFVGGGPGSGIWRTTDAGATWTKLAEGLPAGDIGRIGLTISRAQPATLYAVVQAREGGIFRTDDRGASWRRVGGNNLNQIPWYFSKIRVDPSDADRLYVLGVQVHVTEDGGRTWRSDGARSPHVDHHAMWIDPSDPDHLVLGNDGGLYLSHDRGRTWDFTANLPITQYYAIAVDMREPHYFIYGGTQDNRTWGGPSETRNRAGILNSDWFQTVGGDGFYAAIDPTDPDTVYSESQNGGLIRYDGRTGERKSIRPQPKPGDKAYRFNWSAPLLISPHDPKTLYFGANVLFRSTDRGDAWTILGGDLTRERNRDELPLMGKTWPKDAVSRHEGTAEYGNISTLDESTLTRGLLYVGTDDGLVQVSRDGGVTWTKYDTFPGVPAETYVSRVVASRHAEATVYVTLDGHRSNDFAPYVLKSTDYGKTWTSIASNLPKTGSVHVIREGLRNPKLLFAGTEFGLFASLDTGATWARMTQGFPTVAVHDIVVHPRDGDLVVGTHGRGLYVFDDVGALEAFAPGAGLVAPARPSVLFNYVDPMGGGARGVGDLGDKLFAAPNPPFGAAITYVLDPAQTGAEVTLAVRGADGTLVRTLEPTRKPGINRVTWDLRGPAPFEAPRPAAAAAAPENPFQQAARGPWVLPGTYTAVLGIKLKDKDAVESKAVVTVVRDPQIRMTDVEFRALHDLRVRTAALQGTVQAVLRAADQAKSELDDARRAVERAGGNADATTLIAEAAKTADDIIAKVRGAQRPPDAAEETRPSIQQRIARASGEIGSVNSPATPQQRETIETASKELDDQKARVNELTTVTMPALRAQLDKAGVPWTPGRRIQ